MLIRKILLIIVVYQIMVFATRPLVPLYAKSMGASTVEIGFLVAVYSFFPLLFAIPIGKISDRIGDKIPTIIGTFGLILGMFIPVIYPSMFTLYVSQALIGISQIFINVNLQNLLGAASKPEDRDKNYSYFSLAVGVGGGMGPIVGGYIAEHSSYVSAFLASTCVGVIPIALSFLIPNLKRNPKPDKGNFEAQGSTLQLLRLPDLQKALLVSALVLYSRDLYIAYFPLYASSLHYSETQIGQILTVQGIALLAVRWLLPYLIKRLGRDKILYQTLIFAGLSFALTPLFSHIYMLYLLAILMGIGLGCGQPLSMSTTYNASPPSRTAEVLGLRLAISRLAQVIAPLSFGAIGTIGGLNPVFYLSGLLLFGGSYIMARTKKEVQEQTPEA